MSGGFDRSSFALPTRSTRFHPTVSGKPETPGFDLLRSPIVETDSGSHLWLYGLSGTSHGNLSVAGRVFLRESGCCPPGNVQEKQEVMEQERQTFLYGLDGVCSGAIQNGVPKAVAESIFDEISRFAAYAFNKSHAVAYAYLAYQTAYLKCHYFSAYMAALMTSVIGDFPKLLAYSSACKKAGVAVLPPHINESHAAFTCTKQGIRFGLHAVKNVGIALIEKLERERQAHGAFTDLYDFCERMQGIELNKRALESLIQSGALDGLGWNRRQMLTQADAVLSAAKETAATQVVGQMQLFGGDATGSWQRPAPEPLEEFSPAELLRMEREVTGMYLSGNPFQPVQYLCRLLHVPASTELSDLPEQAEVTFLGILQSMKPHLTKNRNECVSSRWKMKPERWNAWHFRMSFVRFSRNCSRIRFYGVKGGYLFRKAVFLYCAAVF